MITGLGLGLEDNWPWPWPQRLLALASNMLSSNPSLSTRSSSVADRPQKCFMSLNTKSLKVIRNDTLDEGICKSLTPY